VSNRIKPWDSYADQRTDPRKTRRTQSARIAEAIEQRQERADEARRGPAPLVSAALAGRPSPEEVERWTRFLPSKPPGRGT
jgi:hypothetical protein